MPSLRRLEESTGQRQNGMDGAEDGGHYPLTHVAATCRRQTDHVKKSCAKCAAARPATPAGAVWEDRRAHPRRAAPRRPMPAPEVPGPMARLQVRRKAAWRTIGRGFDDRRWSWRARNSGREAAVEIETGLMARVLRRAGARDRPSSLRKTAPADLATRSWRQVACRPGTGVRLGQVFDRAGTRGRPCRNP